MPYISVLTGIFTFNYKLRVQHADFWIDTSEFLQSIAFQIRQLTNTLSSRLPFIFLAQLAVEAGQFDPRYQKTHLSLGPSFWERP